MANLSWVYPVSFVAMGSDTHLLYFTKLSRKSLDFYFLLGIHLNQKQKRQLKNVVFALYGFVLSRGHYGDVIMSMIASQITSLTIDYSTVYSDADQRKHQSSASLAFVRGIHRGPVNSPHKWPVTRKMFPFDDVIMHLRSFILKTLFDTDLFFAVSLPLTSHRFV